MLKRTFDFFSSGLVLLILLPVLFCVAIWIRLDDPGPVIFLQRRAGRDDREFSMLKFRTMKVGTPNVATDKLTNPGQFITRIGVYLRKYSIDELPQLWNILRGDMSVVGPRPALYNQYELRQARNELNISSLRPGLTGWAQINGRDDIPLAQKIALDKYYLEHQSFFFDMKIIFLTAFRVFHGNG